MWFLILLLTCWAADIITSLTGHLDSFDALNGDKTKLMSLYLTESARVRALFSSEAASFLKSGFKELDRMHQSFGVPHAVSTMTLLNNYHTFFFHSTITLDVLSGAMQGNLTPRQQSYRLSFLDQIIETLAFIGSFTIQVYTDEDGIAYKLDFKSFFNMPIRHGNPFAWVRIVFYLLDTFPVGSSRGIAEANMNATDNSYRRVEFFRTVMLSLMKMEYIFTLIFPNATIFENERKSLLQIVKVVTLMSFKTPQKPDFLTCTRSIKLLDSLSSLFNLFHKVDAESTEEAPTIDPKLLTYLCESRAEIILHVPRMAFYLSQKCAWMDAQESLLKQTVKSKAKARKTAKVPPETPNSIIGVGINTSSTIIEEPKRSDYDSDSDEIFDEKLRSLSLVSADWNHTQAWLTAALIHVVEYCRVHVLYPELDRIYEERPKKFRWDTAIQQTTDTVKFCVKAVNKRHAIIKSDEIFKFLPDHDTIHDFLTKRLKTEIDQKALSFILLYAPGDRLNETASITSTLIDESSARFKLIILGLHRACNYIRESGFGFGDAGRLCKQVRGLRNEHAHPSEFTESQIAILKEDLKEWVSK